MTGSVLVHILLPIVIPALLVAWLAIVFHADTHPPEAKQEATKAGDVSGETTAPETTAPETTAPERKTACDPARPEFAMHTSDPPP